MGRVRVNAAYKWWRNAVFASGCAFVLGVVVYGWLNRVEDDVSPWRHAFELAWRGLMTYGWWVVAIHAAVVAGLVLADSRHGERTLAWLFILGLVPGLGLVAYLILGPDLRQIQRRRQFKHGRAGRRVENDRSSMDDEERSIDQLWRHMGVADARVAETVEPYFHGAALFARLEEDIRAARSEVLVEYYIYRDDALGRSLRDALADAARRGVSVRFMVDAAGSHRLGRPFYDSLTKAGAAVRRFHPVAMAYLRGVNYRNHRKIVVVDGRIGYVGGFNVGDEYLGLDPRMGTWLDAHLRFEGDAVGPLRDIFQHDWILSGDTPAAVPDLPVSDNGDDDDGWLRTPSSVDDARPTRAAPADAPRVRIVASGPDMAWDAVHRGYFGMVATARARVWIATPYLVPGPAIVTALTTAALAGVDVRVLIPGQPDSRLVYWCTLDHVEALLQAGVKVYRYAPRRFVHAKMAVVDDQWSSIGTANWDARSMAINFEVQAFVSSKALAARVETAFLEALADAEQLNPERWQRRGLRARFAEGVGRLIAPLA